MRKTIFDILIIQVFNFNIQLNTSPHVTVVIETTLYNYKVNKVLSIQSVWNIMNPVVRTLC